MLRSRWLLLAVLGLLLLSLACELGIPLIIESAVNAICAGRGFLVDTRALGLSLALLAGVVLLNALAGWGQERLSAKISLHMALQMRQDLFSALMEMPLSAFSALRQGDLMSRVLNDTELAASVYTECFRELLASLIVLLGCAVIMFVKSPPLAAVSIGVALLSVFVMGALGGRLLPAFTRRQTALGELNAHIEESLRAFQSCALGGRTAENLRRMEAGSREYYRCKLRASCQEYLMEPLMLLFGNLLFLLTVTLGVRGIVAGTLTVGTLQAFILYSRQFIEPLNALSENYVRAQAALAGAERVFRLIDTKGERECLAQLPAARDESGETAALRFENLRFGYRKNREVLRGLTLSLNKGERLALVGRTGEGKTTLASLLLLFYPDYAGRILLEGRELRGFEPSALRSLISLVPQQPQLVGGTLYDNLVYGCESASEADVQRIVRELSLEPLLSRLPEGLQTELGEAEDSLSQGELQLICLARALLRRTPILVLDEATSSLDPDTERSIQRALALAGEERSCLIIAHRLSSVHTADHIAVLSDGVIAEYGTHESLMAEESLYKSLYRTQFSGKEI